MKGFTIQYPVDELFEVDVRIYDTPRDLRRAAHRYSTEREDWSTTLGVCHAFETYGPEDYDKRNPLVAIIRLCKPHLGVGIVSHEATHAAVHVYELIYGEGVLGNGTDEDLAWLVGEFTRQICNFLHEKGYYK